MGQEYDDFEIIVTDLSGDVEFGEALAVIAEHNPRFNVTRMVRDARFPISDKMAFNVAIKAFCAEKEYPYVDNTEICEQYADLWQYDGIHVRQEFYAHWGANMIRAMRQYG